MTDPRHVIVEAETGPSNAIRDAMIGIRSRWVTGNLESARSASDHGDPAEDDRRVRSVDEELAA